MTRKPSSDKPRNHPSDNPGGDPGGNAGGVFFRGQAGQPVRALGWAALFPPAQVALVAGAALLLRILYWILAADSPFMHTPVVDASFFDIWARTLAEGRTFQDAVFFKPPLYAYVLSWAYRLGLSMQAVQFLQFGLGILTAVLTLGVGRLAFSPRVALGGAVACALLPSLPFFESQLLAEPLTIVLLMGALLLLLIGLTGLGRREGRWHLGAGLLLGIAALGRPNLMMLIGFFVVWGVVVRRRGGSVGRLSLVGLLAGFILGISPATLHNLKYGDLVPVSANMGVNLLTGHHDGADGISAIPVGVMWDDLQLRSAQAGHADPASASRFLTDEAVAWMKAHPGRTLALLGKKAVLLVGGQAGRNNISPGWMAQQEGVFLLRRWWPGTWLVMPFALAGLVLAGRWGLPARLLAWTVAAQAAALLPFFVNTRFRTPLLPLLALFAAAAAAHLWALAKGRLPGARRWPLAVLPVLFVVVTVDWFGLGQERWLADDHFNRGLIAARSYQGSRPDPTKAELSFRRCLELDPEHVDACENLGALLQSQAQPLLSQGGELEQQGRAEPAAEVFTRADRFLAEAQGLHGRATEVYPRSFRSWSNLGAAQMWRGDIAAFQTRTAAALGDTQQALAAGHRALEFFQSAAMSFTRGMQINPQLEGAQRNIRLCGQALLALPPLDERIAGVQRQVRQQTQPGR